MNLLDKYSLSLRFKKRYIVISIFLSFFFFISLLLYAEEKKNVESVSYFQKGDTFFSKGLHKEAIEEFRQALAEEPNNFQANKKLGLSYLHIGNADSAIDYLKAAVSIKPDDTETLIALGEAYSLNKKFDESIRLYKKAVSIEPDNVWFRYKLAEVLSWVKRNESIQEYSKILELEPENNGVRINLAEEYARQAKDEDKPELFNQSILELKRVIKNDPNNALAHKKLGWVYLEQLKLRKAAKEFKIALKLKPDDYEALMLLAQARSWQSRHEEAIKIYQDILVNKPTDVGALYKLGEVLSWVKKYDDAIANYEKILELDPANVGAKIGIARVHGLKGEYKKAEGSYSKILDETPGSIGALLGLAELYRWQWQWKDAKDQYDEVFKLDPVNKAAKGGLKEVELITSPSLQSNFGCFEDSAKFERTWGGASFQFRPFEKTTLSGEFMRWRFYQEGASKIYRNDYLFKIRQHFSNFLDGEIGYAVNDYSNGGTEHSILSSAILNLKEKAIINLSYTHNAPIIDSILTINKDFSTNIYGVGIDYRLFQRWSAQGGVSISDYSDGNKRFSRNAQLSYRLLEVPRIDLRCKYAYLDFDKQNSRYWAPTNDENYSFIADWEHKIGKKLLLGGRGAGNYFSDDNAWGYGVKGYLSLNLMDSLTMSVSASYDDAKTKDPWLGKAFESTIKYVF